MKTDTHTLFDLFYPVGQFSVPLYQRPYVWKQETHWEPLWNDVLSLIERQAGGEDPRHFLGAVVLELENTPPGAMSQRWVIDGQQRLTTTQVLIAAATHAARQAGATQPAEVLSRLIYNDRALAKGDAVYKLWPTQFDRDAFRLIMSEDGPPEDAEDDPENTIQEAYDFFRDTIQAWSVEDGVEPEQITERFELLRVAIGNLLQVVSINLEPGDEAQVIFETLNARGTPLLAMDLVKNLLFHRLAGDRDEQHELHQEVWVPELGSEYWRQSVRQGRLTRPRAEQFLGHWLTAEVGEVVQATQLFPTFRNRVLAEATPVAAARLVRRLCSDAEVMRGFDALPPDTAEGRFFRVIEALDTTTVLPVALLLSSAPEVSVGQRQRGLAAIESWLVRRMLLGLTTRAYNRLGVDLVNAVKRDIAHADDAIVGRLCASTGDSARWPLDDELAPHLHGHPLYGWLGRSRIAMVLGELEIDRRRAAKVESIYGLPPRLSVEHVLPQQWRKTWPVNPPDDEEAVLRRESMVNVLGNLTLVTGELNSSMSNVAWPTKRQRLGDHSILLLNKSITGLDAWDEDSILSRGKELTARILDLWPSPVAFDPTFDPTTVVPEGESDPGSADMPLDHVRAAFASASPHLRLLLLELANHPDERRPFAAVEEAIGWSRGVLAGVLGGYSNTAKANFAKKRPYHVVRDEDGNWWMWMDSERASVVTEAL